MMTHYALTDKRYKGDMHMKKDRNILLIGQKLKLSGITTKH